MFPSTRLYLARGLRDFGDEFVAILLPVYLAYDVVLLYSFRHVKPPEERDTARMGSR